MNTPSVALHKARQLVASRLEDDVSEAGPHEDLRDYGLDSIRLLDVVASLKSEGTQLAFADLLGAPTLHTIAEAIEASGKEEDR